MNANRSNAPVVTVEQMKKMISEPRKKYDIKKMLKEAKKNLRKQGFFVL